MKFAKYMLLAAGLVVSLAPDAAAQLTATQSVTITVTTVNSIAVSASSVPISVGIGSTTDNSTTYDVSTNNTTAVKITGGITAGTAFPTGVSLTVALQAPAGSGTSTGAQTINFGVSAADLVTGISHVAETGRQITYVATATAAAAPATLGAKTVTFTIVP